MGPPPNNCEHIVDVSILDGATGEPLVEPGLQVWLTLPAAQSRVRYAQQLMKKAGIKTVEELRQLPGLPQGRWICIDGSQENPAGAGEPADPLLSAAVLGLSAPSYYAPDRPFIWTEGRLGRRLRLYRPGRFYED